MQKVQPQIALNPQIQHINTDNAKYQEYIRKQFTRFLQTWTENGEKKYIKIAQKASKQTSFALLIRFDDFMQFDRTLAHTIFNNYYRYEHVLNTALGQFMKGIQKMIEIDTFQQVYQKDDNENEAQIEYQVSFDKGYSQREDNSIRNLKCEMLGKLRTIQGTVTRVSEIRPELIVGVFQCMHCGRLSDKIIQQFKYTTPKKCLDPKCHNNQFWNLNNRHSVFADFQKLRVQEDSSKIPPGSMPRSVDVILRNSNIDKGQPGDNIEIVGYLNVIPNISSLLKPGQRTTLNTRNTQTRTPADQEGISGMKGIKELTYKLCFMGIHVQVTNNQFNENMFAQELQNEPEEYDPQNFLTKLYSNLNETQISQIKRIKQNPRIYEDLSESLFHQIFGHLEIKKALLLQLLGGVHKKTQTKISIRGDINVLIVGDPSTAKSQFLKCVNKFVPRSVYTNGKTTTAAGLTASIVKDQESGNVSIEAGALLLADNGICCIDEFDKMQLKDQVAIHEAMEQQTISIAKAGVQATLHARTSILAAANPIFGRYDKKQSLKKNINISPPIMSRFDLYFIICDQVNEQSDHQLSSFIVKMHLDPKRSLKIRKNKPYSLKQIRNYLTIAKKIKPRLTQQAANELRKSYIFLRKHSKDKNQTQYQVTVRQLQSMIRISQALAKLNLQYQVKPEYVRQAFRLLECSIVKLQKPVCELQDDNNYENQNLPRGLSSMNQEEPRIKQKKPIKVVIDENAFMMIKKDIFELFNEKQDRQKRDVGQVSLYLTEEDVVSYLFANDYQSGKITGSNENENKKKIYRKIIQKLIKQKQLMVIQESNLPNQRQLALHPNIVFKQEQQ